MRTELQGRCLVPGKATGTVLFSDTALSFWGGVDPFTGEIIDRHHPLSGQCLTGRVLAIPGGRGSCTGSSVLLEAILNGAGPAALVFERVEEILTLGVIVADEIFGKSLPVICLSPDLFAALRDFAHVEVCDDRILASGLVGADGAWGEPPPAPAQMLTSFDQALLNGDGGQAAQAAMRIIVRMAGLLGALTLFDVTRGHIDGCVYTGPSSLAFAQRLCDWGAQVRVPTTMNAISVDRRQWRAQGVDPVFGEPAAALADAYVAMGAQPTFTCAPYLLDGPPIRGEQIAWAESNAVVYANSVLGARTLKYPDYLDIAIALTGRAPLAGCHLDAGRLARVVIELEGLGGVDDALFPLLGYHIGGLSESDIPAIVGLAALDPGRDALKAFAAAFATTSGAPMFHMVGVTPEAATLDDATGGMVPLRTVCVSVNDLARSWQELDSSGSQRIDVVALGNPHFTETECETLALLCSGRRKHDDVAIIVTCSRVTRERIVRCAWAMHLETFGVQFITDTCWCMITPPLLPSTAKTVMTNSAKYAHYGPGLVGLAFRFGGLRDCVDAACAGQANRHVPQWLRAAHGPIPSAEPSDRAGGPN